jgi:hypothetical protein
MKNRPHLNVMGFLAFTKTGVPSLFSSNPVRITASFHSGRMVVISSSRLMRPRSTHCIAATQVTSLVADARQKVDSADKGWESGSGL